ncbi:methylenetetrahydrofolate--tRNA-(uracil(54)-C(5))-methyltransferase (FADH(2)-oxidizing) TrmFO [uncultured Rhodospira sp.]|uniref:methylenetetrahydrofolate--tRNA-(uracil(54)- C(5))-methyltransferase (FADH(2)-oxidizing) TrmFO n=1 Tax=uncultured Rhodospira sp. TaxID=1936189 RepID=UPI0026384797|nr:methylenetetrahydrofolate--tRNA-(uracil(54)-C(5))-methyltransferase (FADH(2)-oxidizing) TrmFO [uncultured Rhodospira sp.]
MTDTSLPSRIRVIGGGLAGSEAAWQCARLGLVVELIEMRPIRATDAHVTDGLAELVCSNSFRSDDAEGNAVGLLHEEMRRLDSLVMAAADRNRVPAGGALAVDREAFSRDVHTTLESHPNVTITRGEITALPGPDDGPTIIATGPLTSSALAEAIRAETGEDHLAFFDAIAPIVHRDSIDMDVAWFQSRYDKGEGSDYINCPLDRAQYDAFIDALLSAETVAFKEWEGTPYFEGCLPIEVMAERGRETLAHGPMKPVGLTNPRAPDRKPHAIVQLRQDNALGTLYNMVGFQTKMRHGEQARIFRMIPGLERAEFARLGGIHRNTFLNSPRLLDGTLRLKSRPWVRFAGQVTGCEGYVESAAVGLMAGLFASAEARGETPASPPATTALGALLNHITNPAHAETFQPMNVNFGLFPELPPELTRVGKRKLRGRDRKAAYARRALEDLAAWMGEQRAEHTNA